MTASRPRRHARPYRTVVLASLVCVAAAVPTGADAAPSASQLAGRLGSAQSHERSLRSQVRREQETAAVKRARIADLEGRLTGLQATLDRDQARLDRLQSELRSARADLVRLRAAVVRNQRVLGQQLVAMYETPRADLVNVVLDAHGFDDLVGRVDDLRTIARRNAETTVATKQAKTRADAQTTRLSRLEDGAAAQQRVALSQRDAVAHVRLEVAAQQEANLRALGRHGSALAKATATRKRLTKRLDKIQAQQLKAGLSGGTTPGAVGFFPASGTDYTYGDEPEIARKLERMAVALHLHLIGLSGYRSPQHSVEVGGFANDPHTRGQASDTPGLEGVPEATLNRFGLTRPFPGAAEADHVQLVGSAK